MIATMIVIAMGQKVGMNDDSIHLRPSYELPLISQTPMKVGFFMKIPKGNNWSPALNVCTLRGLSEDGRQKLSCKTMAKLEQYNGHVCSAFRDTATYLNSTRPYFF